MDDLIESAESFSEDEGTPLTWRSPSTFTGEMTLDLGLDADGWRTSMTEPSPRYGSPFVADPSILIDPSDPAVEKVSRHVLNLTSEMPDWKKVQAALNLVQTGIKYAYDDELYNVEDFWAKPAEVLYLKRGDCEDTSILFCSIVLAMGLEAVLLDFPGHMAVGVCLKSVPGALKDSSFEYDGKTWWYCETATNDLVGIGKKSLSDEYVVEEPNDAGIGEKVVSTIAWWRSVIRTATGA